MSYIIITGANGGIGNATVSLLADHGYNLILVDLNDTQELAERIQSKGVQVLSYTLDVSNYKNVEDFLHYIQNQSISITGLVNLAGIIKDRTILKMNESEWDAVINVNLKGTFNMIKTCAMIMKEQGGAIITVGSVVAKYGNYGQANYVASKAGVVGLTKTAAREFAKYKIRINCIVPGIIETPMSSQIPEHLLKQSIKIIPLGRLGRADEIATVIKFLLSDESSYITGTSIQVDGGIHM